MPHDIDLTLTFEAERDAERFVIALDLSHSNMLDLGCLGLTFDPDDFPELDGCTVTIFGQSSEEADFDHRDVADFFDRAHKAGLAIHSIRIHVQPRQLGEGYRAYTDLLGEEVLQRVATRLGTKPPALDGEVFGVSVDSITLDQLHGLEIRDYSGDLQRMAIEVFDGLEPVEPHDEKMRFFVVRDGKAVYLD